MIQKAGQDRAEKSGVGHLAAVLDFEVVGFDEGLDRRALRRDHLPPHRHRHRSSFTVRSLHVSAVIITVNTIITND